MCASPVRPAGSRAAPEPGSTPRAKDRDLTFARAAKRLLSARPPQDAHSRGSYLAEQHTSCTH